MVFSPIPALPIEVKTDLGNTVHNQITIGNLTLKNRLLASAVSTKGNAKTNTEQPQPGQGAREYFLDGIDALDDQEFDKAVGFIKQAIELDPKNLEFQYYLGITYVRIKRYQAAREIFESLVQKDAKLYLKAYFDIAAIYSQQKDYGKALKTLKIATKIDPENARISLETGYAHKNLKQYDKAVQCFEKAQTLDPKLTQLCIYMIGATRLEEEKFDSAVENFHKAVEIDPNTSLAESARQTIPRAEIAAWARKPWYLLSSFNWGYDDNVARDPLQEISGGPLTGGTGKGDQFQTLYLRGGYKFFNQKNLEAGVGLSFFTLGYRDWTDSNVTSLSPHIYIQGNYDPVFFRFQYDLSYFYSGGEKQGITPPIYLTCANNSYARLRMHSFMPTISIIEPYDLRTDINLSYQIKNYVDGLTADASRYGGDITQSYKVPNIQFYPRIGYRHVYEPSGDNPSTYRYNEVFAGISSAIYWGIWGDLSFAYMRTDYPEFSLGETRKDSTYTTTVSIKRTFFHRLLISFSYLHLKNDSDYEENGKDLYTFRKNVYMMELTYTF